MNCDLYKCHVKLCQLLQGLIFIGINPRLLIIYNVPYMISVKRVLESFNKPMKVAYIIVIVRLAPVHDPYKIGGRVRYRPHAVTEFI